MDTIKDTYKNYNIPKDWKLVTIGSLGSVSTSSVDKKSKVGEDEVSLINYTDVFNSLDKKITAKINFMRVTARSNQIITNQVHKGDVLFTPSSETKNDIGISAVVYEDIPKTLYSYHLLRLSFKKELNLDFKCYLFNSEFVLKQFELLSQGLTRYTIGLNNFDEILTLLPPLNEQQKIAEILSTVDEQISLTEKIIEKSKELKKGLMQKLFSEGIGHTEFKDTKIGRIPKDWEVVILNDLLSLLTDFEANGSFASVKENVRISERIDYAWYVRATDLENKSTFDKVKYVNESSYSFLKKTKLKGNEVLITKRGEIGKVYHFIKPIEMPCTLAPNLYLLKINDKVFSKYLYYYFKNNEGNKLLKRINGSTTIGALYKNDVKKIKVKLPPFPEQQKIADILSEADSKIEKEEIKKKKLEELKRGLMQQLLTGKKRVKV